MEKASKIISKSNNVNSGKAGTITINARKNISIIGSDTSISTSNSGDGKGGDIFINSDHLLIKNGIISSESLFTNYYTLKSIEELNKYFISTGDIVVITNKETNKKTQYVNTSNNLIKMQKNIYYIDNINELSSLNNNFNLSTGDFAVYENSLIGKAQIYVYMQNYRGYSWTILNQDNVAAQLNDLSEIVYYNGEFVKPPYKSGDIIEYIASDGKKTQFIYCHTQVGFNNNIFAQGVKLTNFIINNINELYTLNNKYALSNHSNVILNDNKILNHYIYDNGKWLQLQKTHYYDNIYDAYNQIAQTGTIQI